MMTGFGMGLGGGVVMVLFWIVLIVGAVWLVRNIVSSGQQPPASTSRSEPSADEITKEQFEQMRRDLSA